VLFVSIMFSRRRHATLNLDTSVVFLTRAAPNCAIPIGEEERSSTDRIFMASASLLLLGSNSRTSRVLRSDVPVSPLLERCLFRGCSDHADDARVLVWRCEPSSKRSSSAMTRSVSLRSASLASRGGHLDARDQSSAIPVLVVAILSPLSTSPFATALRSVLGEDATAYGRGTLVLATSSRSRRGMAPPQHLTDRRILGRRGVAALVQSDHNLRGGNAVGKFPAHP